MVSAVVRGDPNPEWTGVTNLRWLAPLVIFIVALALGLFQIGAKSVWHDEALTAASVAGGTRKLLSLLPTYDVHDDLYYVALSLWTRLAGIGETALRAPSAAFAAAAAALLYLVALQLTGWRVALGAATLFVGSETFLAYAQEARPYALGLLLVTASTLAVLRVAARPRSRITLAIYLGTAVVAIFAHLWTGFAVAAQLLWLFTKARKDAVVGGAVIAVIVSPLAVYGALNGTPGWIPALGIDLARLALVALAGGSPLILIAAGLAIARCTWLIAHGRSELTLPLLLATVPIIGLAGLSVLEPAFIPRYLLFALPGLAMVCAAAALSLRAQDRRSHRLRCVAGAGCHHRGVLVHGPPEGRCPRDGHHDRRCVPGRRRDRLLPDTDGGPAALLSE